MNISEAAKYFVSKVDGESGDVITHLKIQKLTYYAQAWHLAINDVRLFDDVEFQAWVHGPVSPKLYEVFKEYGGNPIPPIADFDDAVISFKDKNFLDDIWNVYGIYGAKHLENLTHKELPWLEARKGLPDYVHSTEVIKDETMKSFYREQLEDE